VVDFNASAPSVIEERKLQRLARAMGLAAGESVSQSIRTMIGRLGLPRGLDALEVPRSAYPRIIAGALADHCHKTNPREASGADYEMILDASR
jgi:alcohol dehydrogenase class IV